MTLGQTIRYYREKKGMTKTELVKKCFLSYSALSHYEKDRTEPSFITMIGIAKVLEVDISEFIKVVDI